LVARHLFTGLSCKGCGVAMDEAAKRRLRAGVGGCSRASRRRRSLRPSVPRGRACTAGSTCSTPRASTGLAGHQQRRPSRATRCRAARAAAPHPAGRGPQAAGFGTERWTLKRVRETIQRRFGARLQRGARVAAARPTGLPPPEARAASQGARRSGHCVLEEAHLAGAKKKCRQEGRRIVFVDESGPSERPTRVRTWAPVGQPPRSSGSTSTGSSGRSSPGRSSRTACFGCTKGRCARRRSSPSCRRFAGI